MACQHRVWPDERIKEAYQHIQGVVVLEAGDHGSYERVARDSGKHIALVPDMFHLLEAYHWYGAISSCRH